MTDPQRTPRSEFSGTQTQVNLKNSFALDLQFGWIWRRLARQAQLEGQPMAASLLQELSEARELVADGCLDFLLPDGEPLSGLPLGNAMESLRAAQSGRGQDLEGLQAAAVTALSEGFPDVASWFETLAGLRQAHLQRVDKLLEQLAEEPQ